MVNKHANTVDVSFKYESWRKDKHDINIFLGKKIFFWIEANKGKNWSVQGIVKLITFWQYWTYVHFTLRIKTQNSRQLTFVVKSMLNILCRHSFCDFAKIPQKFLPLPMLEITTDSTYFLIAKEKMPILRIELLTNKNIKGFKTLHLNPQR